MKKTSKIIISFAVALAVVATVLIVAVFKKDESKDLQPSVLYTLQPTVNTVPQDTGAWVDPNAVWSDLVSDTDAAITAPTMNPNAVTVAGTNGVTQILYVDQFGNIVNPSTVVTGGTLPQGTQPGNEILDDTMPQDNTQANDNASLSEYEINSQGVITKYLGDKSYVAINPEIGGVKVTGIGDSCFANSSIKSIYIPNTVTYIGARAFENCSYLSNVSFVDSTTRITIGDLAFQNCISLSTIHLPAVVRIGNSAFGNCSALSSITFAEGSEKIGAYCFVNCKALASVAIPASVVEIGQDAFNGCDKGKLTVITPSGSEAETYAKEKAGVMTRLP